MVVTVQHPLTPMRLVHLDHFFYLFVGTNMEKSNYTILLHYYPFS